MKDQRQIIAWQRVEGLFITITALVLYNSEWSEWWPVLAFFLVPDITMIGYIINSKVGAFIYNLGHSLVLPLLLLLLAAPLNNKNLLLIACIWLVHIGVDRLLGFGLKYNDSFKHTHLGMLGRSKA